MSLLIPREPIYINGPTKTLPSRRMTNEDFFRWAGHETALKTRTQWVSSTSGIESRYWVQPTESVADLATLAVEEYFAKYPATRESVRNLILSTSSPDFLSPPTSPSLQHRLHLQNVGCFDMGAACAGFVSGLHTAAMFASSSAQTQLLVSADVRSKFLNPTDLRVSPLFGDGAAVCSLTLTKSSEARYRIKASKTAVDGSIGDAISIPVGGAKHPANLAHAPEQNFIQMKDGPEIFARAVHGIVDMAGYLLADVKTKVQDIDWFIPHQGNLHLVRQSAKLLGFAPEQTVETVQQYGNTSGSSTGLALADFLSSGKGRAGQTILLAASGGGGVGGAALLEIL